MTWTKQGVGSSISVTKVKGIKDGLSGNLMISQTRPINIGYDEDMKDHSPMQYVEVLKGHGFKVKI